MAIPVGKINDSVMYFVNTRIYCDICTKEINPVPVQEWVVSERYLGVPAIPPIKI